LSLPFGPRIISIFEPLPVKVITPFVTISFKLEISCGGLEATENTSMQNIYPKDQLFF
jgi:hypothetical protein